MDIAVLLAAGAAAAAAVVGLLLLDGWRVAAACFSGFVILAPTGTDACKQTVEVQRGLVQRAV